MKTLGVILGALVLLFGGVAMIYHQNTLKQIQLGEIPAIKGVISEVKAASSISMSFSPDSSAEENDTRNQID